MDGLETFFEKIPNWLRWILVPITTVLTAVVVWFLAGIAAKIMVFFDGGRGWGENFFQYLLIPGFAIFWSVMTGALMAPRYRSSTALILGALWSFGAGVFTFFSVLTSTWASLIAIGSMCLGLVMATLSQASEPEKTEFKSEPQLDVLPNE